MGCSVSPWVAMPQWVTVPPWVTEKGSSMRSTDKKTVSAFLSQGKNFSNFLDLKLINAKEKTTILTGCSSCMGHHQRNQKPVIA